MKLIFLTAFLYLLIEFLNRRRKENFDKTQFEKALKKKEVQAIIINSGNANTFTGKKGHQSLIKISELVSNMFNLSKSKIFFASTGVIGEEFP